MAQIAQHHLATAAQRLTNGIWNLVCTVVVTVPETLMTWQERAQTRATLRASNRDLAMETSKSVEFKMQSVKDLRVSFRQPFATPVPGHGELIEPIAARPIALA